MHAAPQSRRSRPAALLALLLVAFLPGGGQAQPRIAFNSEIRPILTDNCFQCHGPDAENRQADLRFDQEHEAKADRGGYFVIVPGQPDASELVARITSEEESERMPPEESGKVLTADEIALLRAWILQGATWSQHWAYVPPRQHPLPPVENDRWPQNWVDRFILARLEAEGLGPAAEADPVTLIRRLSFDLTGLPPQPEEVAWFVRNPTAYERLVDRYLESPYFGERMAMYWLDLVRYADTVGYHGDQDHNISPYRDYVIDAFNDNLAFDQFSREQLAGDLLPECGVDQKIASGYNRLLQTSHEGGVQPQEYLAIYGADRVRNLSAVWMGGTLGCAQCHDHKYDPYSTKDFYAMAAFFADIDEARHFQVGTNDLPTRRPPEIKVLTKRERGKAAQLEQQMADLSARLAAGQVSESQRQLVQQQLDVVTQEHDAIHKAARMTMITAALDTPRTIRVLPRGNWLDESGPIVEPAVPEFLGSIDSGERRATRLDLANWLTDAEHGAGGLTARVFANRLWYLFLGVGISRHLDDLGGQGEPPSHPELLDNLALEFVASGWDVKHLIRLLVSSRTYRQVSTTSSALRNRDPYNQLFARQSRFRLPAEMVRDAALSISGLLVDEYGGTSIKPYQPVGYYRHLNFPKRKYKPDDDTRQWRRGVYVHWQRQFLHPMLKAFDAPSREECTAQRPRSNTPLAALTLLNDPTFVEAARVFAARLLREGGVETDDRLDFAFRLAVSRTPDAEERRMLSDLLARSRAEFEVAPDDARALIQSGLAPAAPDLDLVEHAAWTAVARAVLNMSETLERF